MFYEKIFLGSILLLSTLLLNVNHSSAQEEKILPGVLEANEQHAVLGEELDQFEENQKNKSINQQSFNRSMTRNNFFSTEKLEYDSLIRDNILSDDITFEMYYEMTHTPEPTIEVENTYRRSAARPQAGDLVVTNGTSSKGLTGHAGIFLANGTILSIEGPGKTPQALSIMDWNKRYTGRPGDGKWTKIYRVPNSAPDRAANWASYSYSGKNISYGISTDYSSKNPTYCSKIGWQGYYYGAAGLSNKAKIPAGKIVLPYNLHTYFTQQAKLILTWD